MLLLPPIMFQCIMCHVLGFPNNSVGNESACNAGDPVQFLGWEDPLEKGISYPLQYSWASLVAQLLKNSPAMQGTWVWSLGWTDPLGEGMETYSSNSCIENPHGQQSLVGYSLWDHKKSDTTEWLDTGQSIFPVFWQRYLYAPWKGLIFLLKCN